MPVTVDVDVVVIGAGLSGAAAADALVRRGGSVLVLEQFAQGHQRGSSHGSARIVRRAYGDGLYVKLTGRAFELWSEIESRSGASLVHQYGGLDFGPNRNVAIVARLLGEAGVPHELLPAQEAEARWPGMRFEGDVLFHPQAGVVDSALAVDTMLTLARAAGAQVRFDAPARAIDTRGPLPSVHLADGSTVTARQVVAAVGGWVEPLLAGLVSLPPVTVTQQQVFHFPRRDPAAPPWPSVIHEGTRPVYHLDAGRDGGPHHDRKIGEHDGGAVTTADRRDGSVDGRSRERVTRYVERWLPGLRPVISHESTCLYTRTPTEDFVVDRVGDLVVCSPCSGHGAKFAPLIGEMVAELVTGEGAPVPQRFRLAAHRAGRTAAVSL
jgi:monomeric sarcosine oxidase